MFINAFDTLHPLNMLKCFAALVKDKIIGVRIELLYDGNIYDWYAGNDAGYNSFYPNDFIIYFLISWGKNNGFNEFRFGGGGKPGVPYGVRDHKMKFGGELFEFGRYEKIHNRFKYFMGRLGHRIMHKK
jgi:lipid II:glycine glycyltransferase (peptidoglycan interpeptide bridge formation enzyme)